MSFVPMNDDKLVTLDEALAFIDFCEDGAHEEDVSSSPPAQDFRDSFMLEDIDELLDAAVKGPVPTLSPSPKHTAISTELQSASSTRKKRVRSSASSSTVLQRRKKAELETLREETVKLEEYIAHLSTAGSQHKPLALTQDDDRLSEWHRHAFVQYQQRQRSEKNNRRLKKMLEQQCKISTQLRAVLHKRNVLDGMAFVRTFESPCFENAHFTVNHSAKLMDQLEAEVDGIYRNVKKFYRPRQPSMIPCTSQTTYDEKCEANVMEFATSTPLDWPLRAAFNSVWAFLESSSDRSRKPNTVETKVNLTLPLRGSAACHFHKFHFLRKYEEQDRIIVVWSDIMQMTSRDVRLHSLAHAVFTPFETDLLNACVMETSLKLYVEPTNGENVSSEDLRYGQEVVLGTFGRLMRKFWQGEQNRLLEETSRPLVSD
ncbi:hypothetical protein PHYPSEUDO_009834 [Phytophthora pseudosyringae]|uniref:M96 mating-specific protein family n=1 Tax=Phytophthora pseudosyringae TaxID=221518 RepID=A0A8T1WC95_9STRA|nr:hypothetical protein PHYPSEUDO_009834 [Phytophthora pseudosyringae]